MSPAAVTLLPLVKTADIVMVKPGLTYNLIALEAQPQGMYLSDNDGGKILLPKRYVPEGTQPGDEIRVFVYLDSDDRIVATTQRPRVQLNQAANLTVVDVNNTGAFLDWGLAKDLMVPYAEQLERMEVGKSYVVYVTEDNTGRLIGTSRLNRFIRDQIGNSPSPWKNQETEAELEDGDSVRLLIAQRTDLGYKAIVNNRWWGLVHNSDIHSAIRVGQRIDGFIKRIRDDGKIDLTLNESGVEQAEPLSRRIMNKLEAAQGRLALSDNSPGELIEMHFGVSKRAFKMAIGKLYKERRIVIEEDGIRLLTAEEKEAQPAREQRAPRGERSERSYGDKPRFDRGDRPQRDDRAPRGDRGERSFGDKPRFDRDDRAPRGDRPYGDRPQRDDRAPRGERSFGDKPRFDRDDRAPRGDRPYGDRPQRADRPYGDRPQRADRPYGDRPQRDDRAPRGDRPYGDRPQRADRPYGDRPQRDDRAPRGDRPYGDRPQRADRPYGDDRAPRGDRPYGDRPQRDDRAPRGDRPYGDRPQRDDRAPRGDRPYGDRPQRDDRAPRGDRPYGDRPQRDDRAPRGDRGERSYGDKPRFDRGDRPQRDDRAPRGDRPYGDRPQRDNRAPRAERSGDAGKRVFKSNRKPGENTLSLKKKDEE